MFFRLGRQFALAALRTRIKLEDLDPLPERERVILGLRIGLNDGREHTIFEIGHEFGLAVNVFVIWK